MQVSESLARSHFALLIDQPEIPLAEAALAVAEEEYPGLDSAVYLQAIDRLAVRVDGALPAKRRTAAAAIRALRVAFSAEGYRGNEEQYYDPRNSFLNEVIDRKLGVPITLSILYMEVARRAGLELQGVAFPGHFLVKYTSREQDLFLDPFNGGEILNVEDCVERYRTISPGKELEPSRLEGVGARQILTRMLYNLKKVYVDRGDDVRALWVIDRLILLQPEAKEEQRDRGLVSARLGGIGAAMKDLSAYLEHAPLAPDAEEVASLIEELKGRTQFLN
jgi:regulator of sirC expression with transglutaminase-like and TPR domain